MQLQQIQVRTHPALVILVDGDQLLTKFFNGCVLFTDAVNNRRRRSNLSLY